MFRKAVRDNNQIYNYFVGLAALAEHCATLEALDVGWCQEVTDAGIELVSANCFRLSYFGLIRCDKVTVETVETLAQKYPRISYSTFILESQRLLERARKDGYKFETSAT